MFAGKRVLVTGAGSGIGRALAIRLVDEGAEVWGVSKTASNLEALAKERPKIRTICADLSDWSGTETALKDVPAMDGLVNIAGVARLAGFFDLTETDIDMSLSVNLKSAMRVSQVVAAKMIEADKAGSVVCVSSQASIRPLKGHTAYGVSKAGLDHLVRCMALELGPKKIRTNAVNPTVVMTEMGAANWSDPNVAKPMLARIPMGKFAEVTDVIEAILYLLSNKSAMVNGITLPVDGGFCNC